MPKVLQGGSAGEPTRGFTLPFFHNGIEAVKFQTKNTYGVRFLPAFNMALFGTPEFAYSFIPYRDVNKPPDAEDNFPFTSWYFVLQGYDMVGNTRFGYLSPLNTKEGGSIRGCDPLFDCFLTARQHSNPDFKRLTEKTNVKGKYTQLQAPRDFAVFNMLLNHEKAMVNRLGVCTIGGMNKLKEDLNRPRPASQLVPIDPDWPNYLLGDITSPAYGLYGAASEAQLNDAGMKAICFSFSKNKDKLVDHQPWAIDANAKWGRDILAGRKNIADTENVTRIFTAEEILDAIVSDGFLPYELVVEACSNSWTIPSPNTNKSYSTPPASSAPAPGGGSLKAQAAPASAAPLAAPTPTSALVSVKKFWVSLNGKVEAKAEAEVRILTITAGPNLPVMANDEKEWKTAQHYGLIMPAAPAAVPPPAPNAAGAPPPPPGATAPQQPAPPVAPAAPPAAAAAPAAAPAAPAAPSAPPTPAGPSVSPAMAARPGAGAPPPPPSGYVPPSPVTQPASPASNVPPGPPPVPAAAAAPAAAPVASAPVVAALTPAEQAELDGLSSRFSAETSSLNAQEIQRMSELYQQASAFNGQ